MRKERLDDIVVADMEVDKVADMVADKKRQEKNDQHGAHPACASSKLCEISLRKLSMSSQAFFAALNQPTNQISGFQMNL